MEFEINTDAGKELTDGEISKLLHSVYVEGGYTTQEEGRKLFAAPSVRQRGRILSARETASRALAGMIILVPPDSPVRKLAKENEAEVHLLGVYPHYRGHGLGRRLVEALINTAVHSGYAKLILWSQESMVSAQAIYESAGFQAAGELHRNGRDFKLYEMRLGESC